MSAAISPFQRNLYFTCAAIAGGHAAAYLVLYERLPEAAGTSFSTLLLYVLPLVVIAAIAIWHWAMKHQPSVFLRICTFLSMVWAYVLRFFLVYT